MAIEIKIEYSYYSTKRITPVYIVKEELMTLEYRKFVEHIVNEEPHLRRMNPMRLTVKEDETVDEVDLSRKYFSLQMKGLLDKGAKSIRIRVFEFALPAVDTGIHRVENMADTGAEDRGLTATQMHVRRSLDLPGRNTSTDKTDENDLPVVLPLQRCAKKQKEAVNEIKNCVETKRQELVRFDDKIKRASEQNKGHLSACGNCHLKLGHTRKICTFSPCKSAFSCGILSKHSSEKLERSNLEKETNRLKGKLRTAAKDVENTTCAADKVINSSSRQIEDVIINEMPDRYTSYGLRNWALLNKDVVILQRNLKGKLLSRENVKKLLNNIVMKGTDCSKSSSTRVSDTSIYSDVRKQTDHRMTSQKRLLSEEYAINFPTEKKFVRNYEYTRAD